MSIPTLRPGLFPCDWDFSSPSSTNEQDEHEEDDKYKITKEKISSDGKDKSNYIDK